MAPDETQSPHTDQHGTEDTVRAGTGQRGRSASAPPVLSRGAMLGRYVILELVGSGGMGNVYSAYDAQLDRRVALKVIRPRGGAVSERARARLRLEAQALARLAHPNVIAVHDVDEVDGCVFVAMEFVEGEDLGAWLSSKPPWREVLDTFIAAGRGLAAAHRAGLVHRDFKPNNVLLGKDGRARVLDFGIARRAGDESGSGPLELTDLPETATPNRPDVHTGAGVLGTPAYMSPEQARGEPVDARSDQFSWCLSLWEALFGARPFGLERRLPQALQRPRELGAVPAWVVQVLERGLAWKADQRWPSMDDLLAALTVDRTGRRRRWVAGGVAAALGCAALATLGGLRLRTAMACQAEGARAGLAWAPARRDALRAAFVATGAPFAEEAFTATARTLDAYFSDWSTAAAASCRATRLERTQSEAQYALRAQCLDSRLGDAVAMLEVLQGADRAVVGSAAEAVRGLRTVDGCADPQTLALRAPPADPQRRQASAALSLQLRRAETLYRVGKNAEAIEALTAVADHAEGLGDLSLRGESNYLAGLALAVGGKDKEAAARVHRAAVAAEELNDPDLKARAWTELATLEGPVAGDLAHSQRLDDYALAAASRLRDAPEVTARVHAGIAQQARARGDWAGSLEHAKLAVDELGKRVGDDNEVLRNALSSEALALGKLGKQEEALALLQRARAGCIKAVGAQHPSCVAVLMNVGNTLFRLGKVEEAEATQRQVLAVRERAAPGSADLAGSYSNLAMLLDAKEQTEDAIALWLRAAAILEQVTPGHLNVGTVDVNLCDAYRRRKQWAEAQGRCEQALAIFTAKAPQHPLVADILTVMAECALERGELAKGKELLARSIAQCDGKTCTPMNEASRYVSLAQVAWHESRDRGKTFELLSKGRAIYEQKHDQSGVDDINAWLARQKLQWPEPREARSP